MPALVCLTDDILRAYQSGTADPAAFDAASSHLSSCPSCLNRLQALETADDPLLRALRRQQALPPSPLDPLVAAAVAKVPPAAGTLTAGTLLNEYRLLEKLGAGGMGTVYRALHVRLDKEVALKVIHPMRVNDSHVRQRFTREMRAIGKLRHPHIVLATDAGEAAGTLYLVMELEQGTDLARYVRDKGPLPIAEACEYARQAALGLQAAHDAGLVHRDVKPSNLFRTASGQIKLLDLGLALLEVDDAASAEPDSHPADDTVVDVNPQTAAATLGPMGTADYMAPEQWSDAHHVDSRADLYSLGCTLFFLLIGQPPFTLPQPPTRSQVREAHLHTPPPKLRSLRPDTPVRLETLVSWLLAKKPEDRPASAAEVARQLAVLAKPKSHRALWAATACLLLVGAIAIAAVLNLPDSAVPSPAGPLVQASTDAAPSPRKQPAQPPPMGALPMTPAEAQLLQQQWANYLQRPVVFKNSLDMEFALIPPGEFQDVDGCYMVIERPYYLGATEVTMSQFRQFVNATGHVTELEANGVGGAVVNVNRSGKIGRSPNLAWSRPGFEFESQACPVVQITWSDALAFCDWLSRKEEANCRLQTAAEWVWASRAGYKGENYPVDKAPLEPREWFQANSDNHPHAVGALGANPWGLFDMHGNVQEWCLDDYYGRGGRVLDNPIAGTGPRRIIAGGCYVSTGPHFRAIAERAPKSTGVSTVGFRVVCEVKPAAQSPP